MLITAQVAITRSFVNLASKTNLSSKRIKEKQARNQNTDAHVIRRNMYACPERRIIRLVFDSKAHWNLSHHA